MTLQAVLARIAELTQQTPPASAPAAAPQAAPATGPATSFSDLLAQASSSAPASAQVDTGAAVAPYQQTIDTAAAQNGLDPALLESVIAQESGFDPNATSSAGAQGLMQLMPQTAAELGVTNPYDPSQSIDAGARYLSGDLARFGGNVPLALAAYNAGGGAVQRYGGVPPYPETQNYVQEVLTRYEHLANERSAT